MFKLIYKSIYIVISIFIITLIYLSLVGIKTSAFNKIIEKEIISIDHRLSVNLKEVYFKLNLRKINVTIQTENPKIFFENIPISLEEISLNFDPINLINKENKLESLSLKSRENSITNIILIINKYKFNLPLVLFQNRISNGYLSFSSEFSFDSKTGDLLKFKSMGKISNLQFKLLNESILKDLNFNFDINDKHVSLNDINFSLDNIRLRSKIIQINKKKNYEIEGEVSNEDQKIDINLIKKIFKINQINFKNKYLNIESKNKFKFIIDNKLKIINSKINSLVKINSLGLNFDKKYLNDFVPKFEGKINFKDIELKIDYLKKNNLSINGVSKYNLDNNKFDELSFAYKKNGKNQYLNSEINLDKLLFEIKKLNFTKKNNETAKVIFKSEINNNETIIKDFFLVNKSNKISFSNLVLNSRNYKIKNIENTKIKLVNNNQIINDFILIKNKNEFILNGESIDFSQILDDILKNKKKTSLSSLFVDLDTNLKIQIRNVFLDNKNHLKNLSGIVKIKKNITTSAELSSLDSNNGKFKMTINSFNDEKVTTIYADNAEPFVKKFKFIKGFQNGNLDFYSTKKNNLSKSLIKIYDFKLNEVPVLTKILSLASLQGIADLMTGEGIRFDDFEMKFTNNNNVINIDEIYSIGPAISILMSGYVEKNNLVSLRGTLVPATTINKTIGTIPILGDLLIGKKTGEGVFGVSFKIKGPPKNLKTTVNPIKTLTPRFITRTLKKIKKIK